MRQRKAAPRATIDTEGKPRAPEAQKGWHAPTLLTFYYQQIAMRRELQTPEVGYPPETQESLAEEVAADHEARARAVEYAGSPNGRNRTGGAQTVGQERKDPRERLQRHPGERPEKTPRQLSPQCLAPGGPDVE